MDVDEEIAVYSPARFRRLWQGLEWRAVKEKRQSNAWRIAFWIAIAIASQVWFYCVLVYYGVTGLRVTP